MKLFSTIALSAIFLFTPLSEAQAQRRPDPPRRPPTPEWTESQRAAAEANMTRRVLGPIFQEARDIESIYEEIRETENRLESLDSEDAEVQTRLLEVLTLKTRLAELKEEEALLSAKNHAARVTGRIEAAMASDRWKPGPQVLKLHQDLLDLQELENFDEFRTWFEEFQKEYFPAYAESTPEINPDENSPRLMQRRRGSETRRERMTRLQAEWHFHYYRMQRLEAEMRLLAENDEEFEGLIPRYPGNQDGRDPFAPHWWNQMSPEERAAHPWLDPSRWDGPPMDSGTKGPPPGSMPGNPPEGFSEP